MHKLSLTGPMTIFSQQSTPKKGIPGAAMGAASQLPGRGPTDVDDAPGAPAC